jgi:hypothetical protein
MFANTSLVQVLNICSVDERENNPSFEMDDAELQWWLSLPDDATISQVQSPTGIYCTLNIFHFPHLMIRCIDLQFD